MNDLREFICSNLSRPSHIGRIANDLISLTNLDSKQEEESVSESSRKTEILQGDPTLFFISNYRKIH